MNCQKMKKTIATFALLFVFFANQGFAQLENFRLSDYKLLKLERQTLEFNFDLNGSGYKQDYPDNFAWQDRTTHNFQNTTNATYSYYLNSVTYQRGIRASLDFNYHFGQIKNDGNLQSKTTSLSPFFTIASENRRYGMNERFLGYNMIIQGSWNKHDRTDNPDKTTNTNGFVSVGMPMEAGTGRIEPVSDARQAVYILEKLQKLDKTPDHISQETVIELAKTISRIKNERFFDARHKRIYELQVLDSFLLANNIVTDQDITYFANLADKWAYGNQPQRYSGRRLSFVLDPQYLYLDSSSESIQPLSSEKTEEKANMYGLFLGVEYLRQRPVSLFWQNDLQIALRFGILEQTFERNAYEYDISWNQLNASLGQTFGYYPSTRTSARLYYKLNYHRDFNLDSGNVTNTDFLNVTTGFIINYYFSPQLRFNISTDLIYTQFS